MNGRRQIGTNGSKEKEVNKVTNKKEVNKGMKENERIKATEEKEEVILYPGERRQINN